VDRQALTNSIAYCGLVCGMCHLKAECDFCKNTASLCARSEVCFQRDCCVQRGMEGCWECDEFPCGRDMHGPGHDLRIRAFVTFIKAEGADALVDCLLRNEALGIHYGKDRDYDGKGSEEEVIRLLKTGLSG
jgi:hypothetical protein